MNILEISKVEGSENTNFYRTVVTTRPGMTLLVIVRVLVCVSLSLFKLYISKGTVVMYYSQ